MDVQPESCSICHAESGNEHQEYYDELYQDGVIKVTNIGYSFSGGTSIVTLKITKNGIAVDGSKLESLGIYFAPYTGSQFQFDPSAGRMSIKGTMSYDNGVTTSTLADSTDLRSQNGVIVVYGRDETLGRLPARVQQTKYPYAGLLEMGNVDYVSPANNDGCENCHTDPYLKHGYIYGQVNGDPATDFYTCKACHLDDGEGGHFIWQLLVDDPELIIELEEEYGEDWEESGDAHLGQYAYKTTLMNDVHMSHAMEFLYPQSMANCATCHEGKLDMILADDNFNMVTCKSCHAVTGPEEGTGHNRAPALSTALPEVHDSMDLDTVDCSSCHGAGTFREIHTGYDSRIYTSDGVKYSEAITASVDSASMANNQLTVGFSATGSAGSVDSADIVPEVMIGLYGYDTKDFIVNGHDRYDSSGNGVISRSDGDLPKGAYVVGTDHKYFTTLEDNPGSWSVKADLSEWADMINDGTIRRIEIAVLSVAEDANEEEVAINAVSRTFDIASNGFDEYFSPIVKVEDGCNTCHDALGTTFHAPDYGGSVTVCRMCHVGLAGGSHLEMQSRSIDSYVHAIHSFQAFDTGDIDFSNPVEALHYEHHIELPYPTHGIRDCESCHVEGMYDVPDQSKSLPGLLSASDPQPEGWDRNITDIPSYVTGPAARACGGCHRAVPIKEDNAVELGAFNAHTGQGGYMIEAMDDSTLRVVIEKIIAYFE
jgi:hypothetical protein